MVDLSSSPLELRAAEVNFVLARHEVDLADTNKARLFGDWLIRRVGDQRCRDPIYASDVLTEVALFGAQQQDEEFAFKAVNTAAACIESVDDQARTRLGWSTSDFDMVKEKLNYVSELLEDNPDESTTQRYMDATTRARALLRGVNANGAGGRFNELATIGLVNEVAATRKQKYHAFHVPELLDSPRIEVVTNGVSERLAVDVVMLRPRLSEMVGGSNFLQLKKIDYSFGTKNPYAEHVGVINWDKELDTVLHDSTSFDRLELARVLLSQGLTAIDSRYRESIRKIILEKVTRDLSKPRKAQELYMMENILYLIKDFA